METLVLPPPRSTVPTLPDVAVDAAAARRALRDQIARLERRVAEMPPEFVTAGPGRRGPDRLSLGELERVRDRLLATLRGAQGAAAEEARRQAQARTRLEAMRADPAAHRWERVRRADLGELGCGEYRVRPRLGLVGMFAGWWEVTLSSGCPLAMPDRRNRRPENPVLEAALTLLVLAVLVGTVLIFLLVYHDFPLRTS